MLDAISRRHIYTVRMLSSGKLFTFQLRMKLGENILGALKSNRWTGIFALGINKMVLHVFTQQSLDGQKNRE